MIVSQPFTPTGAWWEPAHWPLNQVHVGIVPTGAFCITKARQFYFHLETYKPKKSLHQMGNFHICRLSPNKKYVFISMPGLCAKSKSDFLETWNIHINELTSFLQQYFLKQDIILEIWHGENHLEIERRTIDYLPPKIIDIYETESSISAYVLQDNKYEYIEGSIN